MFAQTSKIDPDGRVVLPKQILDALGVSPEVEVVIELIGSEIVIRLKYPVPPITERIASMGLPVSDWDQMEREIESGRLK